MGTLRFYFTIYFIIGLSKWNFWSNLIYFVGEFGWKKLLISRFVWPWSDVYTKKLLAKPQLKKNNALDMLFALE